MTREEVIAVLEESKRQNEVMRDNPSTFWVSHQMADGVKNAERRISALDMALTALRPVSREQVEKVWRGEWIHKRSPYDYKIFVCKKCGKQISIQGENMDFCPACGSAQTDEAVEMVMERINKMEGMENEPC